MIGRARWPAWLGSAALVFPALLAQTTLAQDASATLEDLVLATIGHVCEASSVHDLQSRAGVLPGVRATRGWVRYGLGEVTGWRIELTLDGGRLIVSGTGRVGSPREVTAEYEDAARDRPVLFVEANDHCIIQTARRLRYEGGSARSIEDLDEALRVSAVELLDPPLPGPDQLPILVGLVDTGVNYLLPEIGARLARDAQGQLLGYDYEDLDRLPFDVPTHSALSNHHHGTQVAALLLGETSSGQLVPYRYPHSDMTRMVALVEDAAAHGLRIVNISLASIDRAPWLPFRGAALRHPEILFVVSAGNHGRDIDRRPVYPAAFDLDNMVVVTSADQGGRLSEGANWGAHGVDLMVPAQDLPVLDVDGEQRTASGSSYAAARVSALATCLLAAAPGSRTEQLKAALFARAVRPEGAAVAHGFISDTVLGQRGICR